MVRPFPTACVRDLSTKLCVIYVAASYFKRISRRIIREFEFCSQLDRSLIVLMQAVNSEISILKKFSTRNRFVSMTLQLTTVAIALIVFSALQIPASCQESVDKQSNDASMPHRHENALVRETSPYLLMHAHNPVNWYGWGEEALNLAKESNKPIFLSIGYSSCHWCHVMERESFLDEEIAKFLNEHFVCIKVDREERPDVDDIYMEALRVVNRGTSGGWPLSMFLTPDAKPFFGGTYFPARDGDRGARLGFLSIVKRVQDAWQEKQEKIGEDANFVTEQVKRRLAGEVVPENATLDTAWIVGCLAGLKKSFDPEFGGFRYAPHDPNIPKFPEPSNLLFLADVARQAHQSDSAARDMYTKTCERMAMGGIQDHLGGGFHRYSVDRFWRIPHFEKMLYDNGQLATVYSEAYELTGRLDFRLAVDEMLEFVLRELRDEEGAFYASLDAESEGVEGKFNRWTRKEIESVLSNEELTLFAKIYGIDKAPNFERQFYVPQLTKTLSENAKSLGLDESELIDRLKPIRQKLFAARAQRIRPLTDGKILTSWNGMMIRGFADAGRLLNNDRYTDAAAGAADFLLDKMVVQNGRLVRTYTSGQAKLNAYLTDYACFIDGLLALHRASGDQKWLDAAIKLQATQDELFWDDAQGGYFDTSNDHESLLARAKRVNDSAIPAGNSVAAGNLVYLANELKLDSYWDKARRTALAASPLLNQYPIAAPRLLIAIRKILEHDGQ